MYIFYEALLFLLFHISKTNVNNVFGIKTVEARNNNYTSLKYTQ